MIGKNIAHYRVTEMLGKGGMGVVYRATDTKLGRDVALKVLPEVFARDADRMARFKREAQVLASLNHPNIASIHGLEESDGIHCLVLELVEGPTLAERIQEGAVVTADGKRFVMLEQAGASEGDVDRTHLTFVFNWFDEVRRRVASAGQN